MRRRPPPRRRRVVAAGTLSPRRRHAALSPRGAAAASTCRPEGTTLLTGRHAYFHGVHHNKMLTRTINGRPATSGKALGRALRGRTLPELLRAGGYATAAVGKWGMPFDVATFEETLLWQGGGGHYGRLGQN